MAALEPPGGGGAADAAPEPAAFKAVFPVEYLERFLEAGVRADDRPVGRARAATVALGVVSSAQGSALAKIGRTSMLAGVKAEIGPPPRETPGCGVLTVTLELPPLSSASARPGRPSDEAQDLTHRLSEALESAELVDAAQLCILEGHHAWHLYLDVYCLDADGSLFDCALLAAVAALADVSLPALELLEAGRLAALPAGTPVAAALPGGAARRLTLPPQLPVALTCGLYRQHCLVDPTWEEEERMHATVTAAVDAEGTIVAMHKAGGAACSEKTLMRCIAAARLRHAELTKVLAAAGVGGGAAPMDAQA